MRTFNDDTGRWCEIDSTSRVLHGGVPCYEVIGRGDIDYFLGTNGELLHTTKSRTSDWWTIRYRPKDNDFEGYAKELIALDAWR